MKILTIASHPDDEILGCGGTIAKLVAEGHTAYTLILGKGIRSRENWTEEEAEAIDGKIVMANKLIGVDFDNITIFDYPDNAFDVMSFLSIVKDIERIKKEINPDVIFTHSKSDLNIDHRITHDAVLTVTRPIHEESVRTIYSFEVLSSTEWNFPSLFHPNVFFDISKTINQKLDAMMQYKSEIRKLPHPRSFEGIENLAKMRGMIVGVECAEAFELIRDVRK